MSDDIWWRMSYFSEMKEVKKMRLGLVQRETKIILN